VVVLIAAITGALVVSGLPGHVSGGIKAAVCKVAGGKNCDVPAAVRAGGKTALTSPRGNGGSSGGPGQSTSTGGGESCASSNILESCHAPPPVQFVKGIGLSLWNMGKSLVKAGAVLGCSAGMKDSPAYYLCGPEKIHQNQAAIGNAGKGVVKAGAVLGCSAGMKDSPAYHLCGSEKIHRNQATIGRWFRNPFGESTRRDWNGGRKGQAIGRVFGTVLSTVFGGKFLKDFGKAGGAGDTVAGGKAGELGEGVRVGRANPSSPAFDKAMSELGQARQGKKGEKGEAFALDEALNLAENYRELNAAERVKFLERLTPEELLDLYLHARGRSGLDAEILADAPAATLQKIDPDDLFIQRVGRWVRFEGKLYMEPGPSYKDIEQGACFGDCWLQSAAGAMPEAVRGMLKENPNGTITAYFGDGTKVTVTRDLPLDSEGRPLGAVVPKDGPGWPAFLEKAFAERYLGYDKLNGPEGEKPSLALEMIGAKVQVASGRSVFSVDDMAYGLEHGDGFVVGFRNGYKEDPGRGIYAPHAYMMIGADPVKGTVTVENPWGTKFSQPITLTLDELEARGVEVTHGTVR
jgi:hypothetical protein